MSYTTAMRQLAGLEARRLMNVSSGAEAMDVVDLIRQGVETVKDVKDTWDDLPETTRTHLGQTARTLWPMLKQRQFALLIRTAMAMLAPDTYRLLTAAERSQYLTTIVKQAGARIGLPTGPPTNRPRPGFSDVQVKQYHKRQRERGRVPGRAQQRRQRELEVLAEMLEDEFDQAAFEVDCEAELTGAEYAARDDRLKPHKPQGTGKKNKGRHQEGLTRKGREAAKADAKQAQGRRAANARRRALALELTGVENPSEQLVIDVINRLDTQIAAATDDATRAQLIERQKRLRQFRLTMR